MLHVAEPEPRLLTRVGGGGGGTYDSHGQTGVPARKRISMFFLGKRCRL